ncbi:carboxypeptidase regulatory-like domain-containing protein [Candidatus Poribacteria bacterium]|nr:carboxypeptidase regulatory-like domain-containing protein [Candidatus Poribacteria bacterium]
MKNLRSHQNLSALLIVMVFALSLNSAIAKDRAQYQADVQQLKRSIPTLKDARSKPAISNFTNGGFETGDFSGWAFGDNGLAALWPWSVCPANSCGWFGNNSPIEGTYDALNGFDGEAGYEAFLYQDVQVPDEGGQVSLWDRIQYDSLGIPSKLPRIYEVQIRNLDNNIEEVPIHIEILLNGAGYTDLGWQNRVIDVSKYAGKTIRVYIELFIPETFTGPAQIEVDDFSGPGSEPSPTTTTIKGRVIAKETGAPINQALVMALQTPTKVITKTGTNGSYEIAVLPGAWGVLCWKSGYFLEVQAVTLEPGDTKTVNFSLTVKARSSSNDIPPEFRSIVNAAPAPSPRHKLTTTWGAIKKR